MAFSNEIECECFDTNIWNNSVAAEICENSAEICENGNNTQNKNTTV